MTRAMVFETDDKLDQKSLIPQTFVANEDHEAIIFDKNDEIFGLSKPVSKQIPSQNCSYCNDTIGRRTEKHFCEFCGLQMCKNCKRERRFPMSATAHGAQK